MDKIYILEILAALKAELIRFRLAVVATFITVSFMTLMVGYFWPSSYTTSVVLYSDVTTIIEPLLRGRASVTEIDRSQQARDVIYGRTIMEAAAVEAGLIDDTMNADQKDRVIRKLRSGLALKTERNNYFTVSYTADNPDSSFETLYTIISVFIADTERKKKDESLGAFNFIDAQVQSYKRQLELADGRLKDFKSKNLDGSEASVAARMAQLRVDIETLAIGIEETQSRINTTKEQLSDEGQYLKTKGQVDELKQSRQAMVSQLESLLLRYQEGYPDIVSLRAQIAEIDQSIEQTKQSGEVYGANVENPLYEELRKQLSLAEVELRAQTRRMQSLKGLLKQEELRAQRVAANQAELSELTRDYNVTRDVYEEMLQRKESARLSMSLDQEGQGVSYRIQDPATFPLAPSGISFKHFAAAGPVLGLLAPLGLLILYILADPHFRSARTMQQQLPQELTLVGVIPHYDSPMSTRLLRKDILILVALSVLAMGAYIGLATYWRSILG
ncbi:chain length-determining protein [Simiduia curdlanivorans]|uniref:XrtA system polysaccharide chain length determinant n=1 Tax=Simiduia curdlanivorans TaxID=1492769 RepID=A0ABV8VCG7_9GAMM|nr:XrtA system polysaccharide chain length determinant [Simiduia curdlanivorans]MDN3638492.1 chain length-determining protein [Simiduia curdlanivorans]